MTLLIILTLLMFKIMRSLRSLEYLKTTVELLFTTQKQNACSSWKKMLVVLGLLVLFSTGNTFFG